MTDGELGEFGPVSLDEIVEALVTDFAVVLVLSYVPMSSFYRWGKFSLVSNFVPAQPILLPPNS